MNTKGHCCSKNTRCKLNGQYFSQNQVGIINGQNHNVRNTEKYSRYKEDVIKLNSTLKKIILDQ